MLIIWISGNTGSGKTWLAHHLARLSDYECLVLDGDDMRDVWTDLGLSKEDRWEHNIRVAKLAKVLHKTQNIIVCVIAPYRKLREEITKICNPVWIYMPSVFSKEQPYELPVPRDDPQ